MGAGGQLSGGKEGTSTWVEAEERGWNGECLPVVLFSRAQEGGHLLRMGRWWRFPRWELEEDADTGQAENC